MLAARRPAFQAGNAGSSPAGVTMIDEDGDEIGPWKRFKFKVEFTVDPQLEGFLEGSLVTWIRMRLVRILHTLAEGDIKVSIEEQ